MKATLAHSLTAFRVYMGWYELYEELQQIIGNRLACMYSYSISTASNCPLCSTFFRKLIIDMGEHPEDLQFSEWEQELMDFGASISANRGQVPDTLYQSVARHYNEKQMVALIAFAGQMIATNIFSNVTQTDIDDYLTDYLKPAAHD